jgi:cytoskeletal protein RodZ
MDSFGSRLRYERERRQIALKSIAESTKIGIKLLEGLERDVVSRWPSGIFRKSLVRSYAAAIGLDPEPFFG